MAQGTVVVATAVSPSQPQLDTQPRHHSAKLVGAAICTLLAICLALYEPPHGLTTASMHALGILVWAISFWILDIIPEYVVSVLMCTLWVTVKAVPFQKAFANFSDPNWWILVGAFGVGAAAVKSGLLRRIALVILNLFPATFRGQTWGLLGAGTVMSPLIPSAAARSAIASPLALAISDLLHYRRKSSGASGLFGAMFMGFCVLGTPAFLSGSFINYATMGQLPKNYQVNWITWFLYALPWAVVTFVGSGLAINFLYRPAHDAPLREGTVSDELAQMGPMSLNEKITFAFLILTLAMWMTEAIHKVSSGEVAIFSICGLLALNVLTRDDFRKGIDWPAIIYIGCLMNIGTVFQLLKIDLWLGHSIEPLITRFVANPYLFVMVLAFSIFVARFLFISMTSSAVIITVVLGPLVALHGMHPWVIAFMSLACANVWFLFYMNAWFVLSFYGTGGDMIEHRKLIKLSAAYAMVAVAGFLVSVPYWRYLGLIH